MRSAKNSSRSLLIAWVVWLLAAAVVGCLAAVLLGGHGSVVFVIFALAVGVFGALGSSVILSFHSLSRQSLAARTGIVSLVAFSPMLALALYGLLAKGNYRLGDALSFLAPSFAGAVVVGALAEWIVDQSHAHTDAPAT